MLSDEEYRKELLERRAKLITKRSQIEQEIAAYDTMIGGLSSRPESHANNGAEPNDLAEAMNELRRAVKLNEAVRDAIRTAPDRFTVRDVLRAVDPGFERQTVSSVFWRIAKDTGLKIIKKGSGRAPTVYSKV